MESNIKKILIVEDEKPLAKALMLKLTHVGFSVKTVHNGKDALILLQNEQFDLVVLDLVIPEIDGFTVLKTIRETNKTLPVIVVSNLSQAEDNQKVRAFGVEEFFIKSNISIGSIADHITNLLK